MLQNFVENRIRPELAALERVAKEPQDNGRDPFMSKIQCLCNDISSNLELLDDNDFAHAWLLEKLIIEFLCYAIEDDYVDLNQERLSAATALSKLQNKASIVEVLPVFLKACRNVANQVNEANIVEIHTPALKKAKVRVATAKLTSFHVSSGTFPFVGILEDNFTDPEYAPGILDAYTQKLQKLKERDGITHLGFVEKSVGPVGAIGMLSSLVIALKLPAIIYRASYWSRRAKIVGRPPRPSDRVALVYDLLVSGDGLQEAARQIKGAFPGTEVPSAVVLLSYGESPTNLNVDPIERHKTFAADVQRIIGGETKTPTMTLLKPEKPSFSGLGEGDASSAGEITSMPPKPESYTVATIRDENSRVVARVDFMKKNCAVHVVLTATENEPDQSSLQTFVDSVNAVLDDGNIKVTPYRSIQITKDNNRFHLSKLVGDNSNHTLKLAYDDEAIKEARFDEIEWYDREHPDEPTVTTQEILAKLRSIEENEPPPSNDAP